MFGRDLVRDIDRLVNIFCINYITFGHLFSDDLDPAVAAILQEAIREFEKMGATVKEVDLPNSHLAISAYYILAPAEASSNLDRRSDWVSNSYPMQ